MKVFATSEECAHLFQSEQERWIPVERQHDHFYEFWSDAQTVLDLPANDFSIKFAWNPSEGHCLVLKNHVLQPVWFRSRFNRLFFYRVLWPNSLISILWNPEFALRQLFLRRKVLALEKSWPFRTPPLPHDAPRVPRIPRSPER